MKKILFIILTIVISITSCSKFDDNYRNYDGSHFGTHFSKEGLTIISSVSKPNSVGGVTILITVTNETGRTIKDISLNGDMQNVYGESVYCDVWRRTGMPIDIADTIYNGETKTYQTNNCFYNGSAKKYCINAVSVTFFD